MSKEINRILNEVSSFYPEKSFTELLLELNINMKVETYGGEGYQQLNSLRDNTNEPDTVVLNRVRASDLYRKMTEAVEERQENV